MPLQIHLLGEFSLKEDGEEVYAVHSPRLQSLIAFLVLHDSAPQLRRHVAFTFWPDSTERQARNNLRKLLHDLRQAFPRVDRYLRADARTLHWQSNDAVSLDVTAFDALLEANSLEPPDPPTERARLEEAISLYRGDLLPSSYDDWILPGRERLRQTFGQALERLMWLAENEHDFDAAIEHANRLLRFDPLHEAAYRRLMRIYARQGDGASALRVYHACVTRLEQELGVEPGQEIQDAYARLLGKKIPEQLRAAQPPGARATRLVGRSREWQQLRESWSHAASGSTHLCLIRGEAGIGKTRLAQELFNWVGEKGFAAARTRAYEAAGSLAFTPIIDWLRTPPLQAALRELEQVWSSEVSRLLPELLAENPELPRPEPLQERWQRQRLFEALARAVLTCRQPLLLVLDDVQWCDPDTLEWLHYLIDHAENLTPSTRSAQRSPELLVVLTMRTEEVDEDHPVNRLVLACRAGDRLTEIDLPALDQEETAQLATVVAVDDLDEADVTHLFAYTEGNPLFLVETLASDGWQALVGGAVQEGEPQQPGPIDVALPPKVYAVIQARLSHLARSSRELAALAAVVGRAFSFDLLREASAQDEREAMRGLDELWRRGIVREHPDGGYDFSHDRIRDVTYAEIGPVQRPLLHLQMARSLERLEDSDSISAQLAWHYDLAGEQSEAIRCYNAAVKTSAKLYALDQVNGYLDRLLALLDNRPTGEDVLRERVVHLLAKGQAMGRVEASNSVVREDILARAYSGSIKLGDLSLQFRALFLMRGLYGGNGNWLKTGEVADRLLAVAQELQAPSELDRAYSSVGVVHFFRGQFQAAEDAFDQCAGVPFQDALQQTQVSIGSVLRVNLDWLLGYPERGRRHAAAMLEKANQLASLTTRLQVFEFTIYFLQWIGDMTALRSLVHELNELLELYTAFSLPNHLDFAVFIGGWLMATDGEFKAGLARMQSHIDRSLESGHHALAPYNLSLCASMQAQAGQVTVALKTLERAAQIADRGSEHMWLAEILRQMGEVKQQLSHPDDDVRDAFQGALDLARQQGAHSLELRAAMSMARLWQHQGRRRQAHALLSEIYDWFTEGFDTPDLQAASALLAELGTELA